MVSMFAAHQSGPLLFISMARRRQEQFGVDFMPILDSILDNMVPGPFGKSSSVCGGGGGAAGREG